MKALAPAVDKETALAILAEQVIKDESQGVVAMCIDAARDAGASWGEITQCVVNATVKRSLANNAPPCFICGAARPWDDVGWRHRMNREPASDAAAAERARCDRCWEVESRLTGYLKNAKAREEVRKRLAREDNRAERDAAEAAKAFDHATAKDDDGL